MRWPVDGDTRRPRAAHAHRDSGGETSAGEAGGSGGDVRATASGPLSAAGLLQSFSSSWRFPSALLQGSFLLTGVDSTARRPPPGSGVFEVYVRGQLVACVGTTGGRFGTGAVTGGDGHQTHRLTIHTTPFVTHLHIMDMDGALPVAGCQEEARADPRRTLETQSPEGGGCAESVPLWLLCLYRATPLEGHEGVYAFEPPVAVRAPSGDARRRRVSSGAHSACACSLSL